MTVCPRKCTMPPVRRKQKQMLVRVRMVLLSVNPIVHKLCGEPRKFKYPYPSSHQQCSTGSCCNEIGAAIPLRPFNPHASTCKE